MGGQVLLDCLGGLDVCACDRSTAKHIKRWTQAGLPTDESALSLTRFLGKCQVLFRANEDKFTRLDRIHVPVRCSIIMRLITNATDDNEEA